MNSIWSLSVMKSRKVVSKNWDSETFFGSAVEIKDIFSNVNITCLWVSVFYLLSSVFTYWFVDFPWVFAVWVYVNYRVEFFLEVGEDCLDGSDGWLVWGNWWKYWIGCSIFIYSSFWKVNGLLWVSKEVIWGWVFGDNLDIFLRSFESFKICVNLILLS